MPDIDIQPAANAPAPGAMGAPPPVPPSASQMPQDGAQPQGAPESGEAPQLPPEVLKLHAVQGLIAGAPAAVSMDISNFAKTEDGKTLAKYAQQVQDAGLGFYKSMSGDTGAIFNGLFIHPQDLQAADKAGKLTSVAPPWTKVSHEISKAGENHPALAYKGPPGGPASATPQQPPQAATGAIQPAGAPLPAQAQNKLLQARIAATLPAAPTGGAAPGSSRLLNSVLRPIV